MQNAHGVVFAAAGGTQSIDFVDPDLGQPAIWKANLAIDHELPWWGVVGAAEVVLSQVKEGIYYQHLNLGAPTAVGQDGRLLYWNDAGLDPTSWDEDGRSVSGVFSRDNANFDYSDAIIARPTTKGESQQLTLSLNKPFNGSDWSWMTAYTYTNATEVSPLTSSTSGSQWGNNVSFDPNGNVSSTSSYEIQDRFTAAVTWKHAFFGDYNTMIAGFYEGRSGRPYSYAFDNDVNGDGRFGNDLLYIPSGPGDVLFANAEEEAAFWDFVYSDDYLSTHRGQVAERNAATSDWVNQFDIRVTQELPGFMSGHKSEIWLDVLNVGNLINKDWGRIEEIGFPGARGVVEYGGVDPETGKYVYRWNGADELRLYDERGISRWSLQVGFRYKF